MTPTSVCLHGMPLHSQCFDCNRAKFGAVSRNRVVRASVLDRTLDATDGYYRDLLSPETLARLEAFERGEL